MDEFFVRVRYAYEEFRILIIKKDWKEDVCRLLDCGLKWKLSHKSNSDEIVSLSLLSV